MSYLIYILVHVMVLLSTMSTVTVSVAFPTITQTFDASLVLAGWVMSIYQLTYTCSAVLIGKVCEIFGDKRAFLACSLLFTIGALLCAFAPTIQLLIFFRFIQSLGGGGLIPSATGILIKLFPNSRQKAIGFSMSVGTFGGIIGPTVGAWLVTGFGWQSIFWFNVPIAIAACIPVIFLLKTDSGKNSHIDLLGAGFFAVTVFSLMVGLAQLGNAHINWFITISLFATGILCLLLFIRHEFKSKDPIIDLEFFRRKQFVASNFYNFFYGACLFGISSLVPLFAVSVYRLTTVQSSLILSSRSVGMILSVLIGAFFVIRWGYRRPLLLGTILMALSVILMGLEPHHFTIMGVDINTLGLLIILCGASGIGMGIATVCASNACFDLSPERGSSIAGLITVFRTGGGAFSIAVSTLVLQKIGNLALGFQISFIGMGVLMLAVVPFIFVMRDKVNTSSKAEPAKI